MGRFRCKMNEGTHEHGVVRWTRRTLTRTRKTRRLWVTNRRSYSSRPWSTGGFGSSLSPVAMLSCALAFRRAGLVFLELLLSLRQQWVLRRVSWAKNGQRGQNEQGLVDGCGWARNVPRVNPCYGWVREDRSTGTSTDASRPCPVGSRDPDNIKKKTYFHMT